VIERERNTQRERERGDGKWEEKSEREGSQEGMHH
jgi:hypothetical protein